MPALLQLWIVIVTIGLLTVAVLTARMIARHLSKAAEDVSRITVALGESAEQIKQATQEVRALVASAQGCVTPVQQVVERFAAIGQRTATVSTTLLEGVEHPLFRAAAMSLGVRSATSYLVKRLIHRFTNRSSSINGDQDHE